MTSQMVQQILGQVAGDLAGLGYRASESKNAVHVMLGDFVAMITSNEDHDELAVTCQITTLDDIGEDRLPLFMAAALKANYLDVRPYAFALVADESTDETEWPIVLTNSIPYGDMSLDELKAAMESLRQALLSSRQVIEAGS